MPQSLLRGENNENNIRNEKITVEINLNRGKQLIVYRGKSSHSEKDQENSPKKLRKSNKIK